MERDEVHALTAAYALDALDVVDERDYETHLRGCDRCRAELADFTETATMLAYALDAPAPPAELRERILDQARAERSNVVPLRPRRTVTYVSSAVAAVAAIVAIGVGLWASSLSSRLDEEREFLANPEARVVALTGAPGRLIVTPEGRAAIVTDLRQAPEGKTYEAWVIQGENAPVPAGLFDGGEERDFVKLDEEVPAGAIVALTVEDAGGVDAPTQTPFVTAEA
jgi:anti-sigma-K factor RskA